MWAGWKEGGMPERVELRTQDEGSSVPPESPSMKAGGGKDLQIAEIQNGVKDC